MVIPTPDDLQRGEYSDGSWWRFVFPHAHVHVRTCTCTHMHMLTHTHTYVRTHTHIYVRTCTHTPQIHTKPETITHNRWSTD